MEIWNWACRAFVAAALIFGVYTLLTAASADTAAQSRPKACAVTEEKIAESVRKMSEVGMGRWIRITGERAQQALQTFNAIPPETRIVGDTIYGFTLARPLHLARGRTIPAGGVLIAIIKDGCRRFAGPISPKNWRLILQELNGV